MKRATLRKFRSWGLDELLQRFPGLAIKPTREADKLVVAGFVDFDACMTGFERIVDSYEIELRVPREFPSELPVVFELGSRVSKKFHTFLKDGSLCLGSPIRLHLLSKDHPTLIGCVEATVVPFLYGYSHLKRHGVLPQGELPHGAVGLLRDYMTLFGVENDAACCRFLELLCLKRRIANKHPCPCGSGKKVGKCHNLRLNYLRRRLNRTWLRQHVHEILQEYQNGKSNLSRLKR